MLAIKLRKIGKKHQHTFRVIVAEKRSKMSGDCVEDLGFLNPHTNKFSIKKERVDYWLKNGAQPTSSVHNVLVKAKIVEGPKIALQKKSKKAAEEAPAQQEVKAEAGQAPQEAATEESPKETAQETPAENQAA